MSNSIQDKFIKNTLYIVLGIILIGLIAVQPYNVYCHVKKTCNPITFSSFKLHNSGHKELTINFTTTIPDDLKGKVEFAADHSQIKTLDGEHIVNSLKIKNLTEKNITTSAKFSATPEGIEKYLERIECPCMNSQPISAKADGLMPINLRIDPKIEGDSEFKNISAITINYELILVD